jgi:arylsulfatase
MKLNFFLILAILVFLVPAFSSYSQEKQPNIILIVIDDLGYGDVVAYGGTEYQTPHIDQLATEGMRFTNFVVAQAVCSASRAAILTGCYPNRLGISGAYFPGAKVGLNPNEQTIAELLKEKNYATAIFGKWHLGDKKEFLPLNQGFDEYAGIPYSNDMWPVDYDGKHFTDPNHWKFKTPELRWYEGNEIVKELKTLEDQSKITQELTDHALSFIERNKKKPFFLYLPHHMVHVPLGVDKKFKGKSKQGMFGDVMMEVDASVGAIHQKIKDLGLEDNTLILFTSDNGPWLNYGNHAGNSGGFREGKGTSYEGGHRVPFIAKWPGRIPSGIVNNQFSASIDLLPTIAEVAGVSGPDKKIDGKSILGLLENKLDAQPRKEFYYYYRKNNLEGVRIDDWKLVLAHPGRTYEGFQPGKDGFPGKVDENYPVPEGLYDLRRDPSERYDVRNSYPEIYQKLLTLAEKARKELGDDLLERKGEENREIGRVED